MPRRPRTRDEVIEDLGKLRVGMAEAFGWKEGQERNEPPGDGPNRSITSLLDEAIGFIRRDDA